MFVLEVVKESKESGYFPGLRIVLYIKELAFDVLYARQAEDAVEIPDAYVAVT